MELEAKIGDIHHGASLRNEGLIFTSEEDFIIKSETL